MADEAGSSSTPALDKLNDYVRRKKQKEKAKVIFCDIFRLLIKVKENFIFYIVL